MIICQTDEIRVPRQASRDSNHSVSSGPISQLHGACTISDWNEFTIVDTAVTWMDPRREGRDYDQQWRASELPTTITSFASRGGFSDGPWTAKHAPSDDCR